MLDLDAFAAFEETRLFDQETANRFRTEILGVMGSKDYRDMWIAFRGREPVIGPLLRNLGLQSSARYGKQSPRMGERYNRKLGLGQASKD